MFGIFTRKVWVRFVDAATGEEFACTRMPATDLPETFELDTVMDLAGEQWHVMQAEPMRREEFARSKSLTLVMERVAAMDPGEILFTVPTIFEPLPRLSDEPVQASDLVIHEDAWRQLEFAASDERSTVDAELRAISRVHREHSASPGWREVHVRRGPTSPVGRCVRWADLVAFLGPELAGGGVAFEGHSVRVEGAVCVGLSHGAALYGVQEDDYASVLCVVPGCGVSVEVANTLRSLASKHDLDLVDWCSCICASADSDDFMKLLTRESG